jgi:hypothetical protein
MSEPLIVRLLKTKSCFFGLGKATIVSAPYNEIYFKNPVEALKGLSLICGAIDQPQMIVGTKLVGAPLVLAIPIVRSSFGVKVSISGNANTSTKAATLSYICSGGTVPLSLSCGEPLGEENVFYFMSTTRVNTVVTPVPSITDSISILDGNIADGSVVRMESLTLAHPEMKEVADWIEKRMALLERFIDSLAANNSVRMSE